MTIVETRGRDTAYATELRPSTEPEVSSLEGAVNRARSQSEELDRLVGAGEALVARLTGVGLAEQKAGNAPMPCGLIPHLEIHQACTDHSLGALNTIFERLNRLI